MEIGSGKNSFNKENIYRILQKCIIKEPVEVETTHYEELKRINVIYRKRREKQRK